MLQSKPLYYQDHILLHIMYDCHFFCIQVSPFLTPGKERVAAFNLYCLTQIAATTANRLQLWKNTMSFWSVMPLSLSNMLIIYMLQPGLVDSWVQWLATQHEILGIGA